MFTVGAGSPVNYILDIENAIASCEITPCVQVKGQVVINESDKYDKLKKAKELLDSGVLSQEEYDLEKKKLLDQ